MDHVSLWQFQGSHFCEKARWALDYKKIPHARRTLGGSYLVRAWWRTGRANLPILVTGRGAVGGSSEIIAETERIAPSPALYPREPGERERALGLESYFDANLGHQVRTAGLLSPLLHEPAFVARFAGLGLRRGAQRTFVAVAPLFARFYRWRHGIQATGEAAARAKVAQVLDRIWSELGGRDHLVGSTFSVADLTASALLGSLLGAPEVPHPLPDPLPPSIVRYRRELLLHPTSQWVLEMYRRHRGSSAEVLATDAAARRSLAGR